MKTIRASRCSCKDVTYDFDFETDAFENTITVKCQRCGLQKKSTQETLAETERRKKTAVYKTNIGLVYLSIIDDFGLAGLRRLLGLLGMPSIGKYKYYRRLRYNVDAMKTHLKTMQGKVHQSIRKYYEEHTSNVPDEDGVLNIDILYDGSWVKRGHTSKVGIGVIIEVCTGFVVDYEVLSKHCFHCSRQEGKLKAKKITEEEFRTWNTTHERVCTRNYEGTSGGMEAKGSTRMFGRSLGLKFRYEHFVGDGDSTAYKSVIAMNNGEGHYENTKVKKLECIYHVQKRMGTRLRKLGDEERIEMKTKTGTTIRRSVLGGRNKVTDKAIAS